MTRWSNGVGPGFRQNKLPEPCQTDHKAKMSFKALRRANDYKLFSDPKRVRRILAWSGYLPHQSDREIARRQARALRLGDTF